MLNMKHHTLPPVDVSERQSQHSTSTVQFLLHILQALHAAPTAENTSNDNVINKVNSSQLWHTKTQTYLPRPRTVQVLVFSVHMSICMLIVGTWDISAIYEQVFTKFSLYMAPYSIAW